MKNKYNIAGIIPARYDSVRFPGKPLAMLDGKPMIVHVVERSLKSKYLRTAVVATDDKRIMNAVFEHGYEAIMTKKSHKSGTDRIAEAAKLLEADVIVNIQGDEPMIDHRNIDKAIKPLLNDRNIHVTTLCTQIKDKSDISNPNIVKLVKDKNNFALYFSRHPIPFDRDDSGAKYYKHIGLYVFRLGFLFRFIHMKQSMIEKAEKLEQLRILDNGEKIYAAETNIDSISVDTKSDLNRVKKLFKRK